MNIEDKDEPCAHKNTQGIMCNDCDELVVDSGPGIWVYHKMEGYPWDTPFDAARAAADKAESDVKDGIMRRIVLGGPINPCIGFTQDRFRSIGVKVEMVAGCEIWNYEEVYRDVYEKVTSSQRNHLELMKHIIVKICENSTNSECMSDALTHLQEGRNPFPGY